MKLQEADYLNKLFSPDDSSEQRDALDSEFPLVDVPSELTQKLYQIANSGSGQAAELTTKESSGLWPKLTAIAASLLVAVVMVQFYQQQQTIKQLEQAQADLKTALHYLGEANRIARAEVLESVNENMKKAGIEPAIDVGREAIVPALDSLETEPQKRTL
jgi:uncharacterized protein HemX